MAGPGAIIRGQTAEWATPALVILPCVEGYTVSGMALWSRKSRKITNEDALAQL